MKKTKKVRWTIISVFLLTCWCWLLSPTVTQAEETGMQVQPAVTDTQFASAWPMYMHDPQHSGRSEYRGPATAVKVKWEADQNGLIITSLVIGADRHIYATTSYGGLFVLDAVDGENKKHYNAIVQGTPIILNNGNVVATDGRRAVFALRSSDISDWKYTFDDTRNLKTLPAMGTGKTLYIHAPDRKLCAINTDTGNKKWESAVYGDFTPVVGPNGTIYTLSRAMYIGDTSCLYAVDPDTGNLKWQLTLSNNDIDKCSLAVSDDNTIYICIDSPEGQIYAVTPDGKLKWKASLNNNLTAPAIDRDGLLYVGSEEGVLYALNVDGSTKWEFETDSSIELSPIINANGIVYVCSGKILYALNTGTGDVMWQYKSQEIITAGPILDDKGSIYFVSNYSKVIALHSDVPYAPYELTVSTDRFNNVNLRWKQDEEYQEDGFIIEQKMDDMEYIEIGTTLRDVTEYELSAVPPGRYAYRVKAYNRDGSSQYSNEVILDLFTSSDDVTRDIRTARFFLNRMIYYKDNSPYMMDVSPLVLEDRTFLPVRYVADILEADIEWLAEERQINIVRGDISISLWIDKPWAVINGKAEFIDSENPKISPTLLPPGRTMLPIRFIAESLDCHVEWDEQSKEVKIVYVK